MKTILGSLLSGLALALLTAYLPQVAAVVLISLLAGVVAASLFLKLTR